MFRALQRRFRARRFHAIERLIIDGLVSKQEVTILDAGGRPDYWEMLPQALRPRTRITCLNFESELRAYGSQSADLRIDSVAGDACDMPQYADASFDLVHSNSVIEHVGSLQNMQRFAKEVRRVGRAYYVQTPNFWFPVEPHYGVPLVHYLPDMAKLCLFTRFRVGYAPRCRFDQALARIDHTRMIGGRALQALFPDGRILKERFGLMVKSITAIRELPAGSAA